jgi:hypothetical protein
MLKKRFNDFVKLDANLKKFLLSENIKNAHPPSLPPRFSPFESKTSPSFRRVYFDAYIKDILKIDGISTMLNHIDHCISFLEFLEVTKLAALQSDDHDDNQPPAIDEFTLDELEIEPSHS